MDESSKFDEKIINGLFANGFMGVEVPQQFDGPGASFFDVVIIIEELAKVASFMSPPQETFKNLYFCPSCSF